MKASTLPANFRSELEIEFQEKGIAFKTNHFYLKTSARDLRNCLALLKNKFEFIFLVNYFYDENTQTFNYVIKNLDFDISMMVEVEKNSIMPSMKKVFCGVVWAEKHYSKMLNIEFKGHVYRKQEEEKRFFDLNIYPEFDYINKQNHKAKEISYQRFSPMFANFFGHVALDIEVKDDFVSRAKFLLNPESKKLFVSSFSGNFENFIKYLADKKSMVFFESLILYFKALEESEDFVLHQEVQIHRMLFLEIERVKFLFHQVYLLFNSENREEEKVEISNFINRLNLNLIKPAIKVILKEEAFFALDTNFHKLVATFISEAQHLADKLKEKIHFNSILTKEEPYKFLEAGISGHILRSFGLDFDQRQRQAYFLYDKVETKTNLSTSGWTQDLYHLKLADLKESCRVIQHLLKSLSPIAHHFNIFSEVREQNKKSNNWFYADIEGAAGLSSICFKQTDNQELINLFYRHEIIYELQKFEYIDHPEPKGQFFKKLNASPLFLLEI